MKDDINRRKIDGFVIICNLEGEIKKVIYNSLEIPSLKKGKLLPSIVEKNNFNKAIEFLKELKSKGALFSWEINFEIKNEIIPLNFSGINDNGELLIMAGNSFSSILDYYDKITEMNNEHINRFRKLLKNGLNDYTLSKNNKDNAETYEELTKLNNELSNVQRKLMKKNKKLENERHKFRITLESIADGVITLNQNGEIEYLNPVAEKILNKKEKNIIGKKFFEIIKLLDPITGNSLEKNLKDEIFAGEFTEEGEVILKRGKNNSIPIAFKSSPLKDNNSSIFGSVIVIRDIRKQKEKEEELKKRASNDKLTGVFNRRMGIIYLNKEIEYARDNDSNLSVCFLDVNNLKEINDNFGHSTGDKLLKQVAEIADKNIRENDAIARFGGDEFLLIFPGINAETADKIWQRIKDEFDKRNQSEEYEFEISVSHGIVECGQKCNLSADELINQADKKMYREKNKMKDGEIRDGS